MDKPRIADKRPCVKTLEAGKYGWCTCGLSVNQPFCDGSHKGTSFAPKMFELTEKTRVALCQCKYSEAGHLCDGSHGNLPDDLK